MLSSSKTIETYKFDAIVIGSGIVGLSVANALIEDFDNVLVVDKESSFGRHVSSRNSEVIHSGIYYKPNSLKARLCVQGNQMMYDFCYKYSIEHNNCGKLIIATDDKDISQLETLLLNGENNGLSNLNIITKGEVKSKEPLITCEAALSVPSAGIVDSHGVMKKVEYLIRSKGSSVIYNMTVSDINKIEDGYRLSFVDVDYYAESKIIINAAGLWSDKIANMVGINDYKIHYCKGEYYQTSLFRKQVNSLIYPIPTQYSLGIHLVLRLDGSIGFGPNAYYTEDIEYSMSGNHKNEFLNHINSFFKIDENDLMEDFCGIRPKLQGPGDTASDFVIINEKDKGYENFINLIGVDSPGLTSSLAIGEYVRKLII